MKNTENNYGYWIALAMEEKDPEKKVKYYSKALELNPNHVPAWGLKGSALLNLKRYEEAVRCFDRVLEIRVDADAWYNKGLCFYYLERYKGALECYDNALKLCPNEDHQLLEDAQYNKNLAEKKLQEEIGTQNYKNLKSNKEKSKKWWQIWKREDKITEKYDSEAKAKERQILRELAIEKTIRELTRVIDIPIMSEGEFRDRAVISGFAKYKGLDYWMAIVNCHPEVQSDVRNIVSRFYKELLDQEGDEENAQKRFKEMYKGFSDVMEYARDDMRANGWKYPWE
jgi:tetratricopeptide (TPR) repeat protein